MTGSQAPRWVAVWCPDWPIVGSGAQPGEPVAVLRADRVVARSTGAVIEGVEIGHRRREAQAACPSLRLVAHEPQRDARAFERIARLVAEMAPQLEVVEPGLLGFAARGPSRYYGGDAAMAARVAALVGAAVDELLQPGVGGCVDQHVERRVIGAIGVGVADGRFTATAAARIASRDHDLGRSEQRHRIVDPGPASTAAFLAPLTIRSLGSVAGLDPGLVHLFARLGLRRLGDLAALPAASVLGRFGAPGAFAHRIACGGDDRPPDAGAPPTELAAVRHFGEPVPNLDALVFAARQLADELTAVLRADGRVCTRLAVTAESDHGEHSDRSWHRAEGFGVAAMVERARWQLDGWATADHVTAGVVRLSLEAIEVRSDAGTQLGFWGGRTRADEWAARAVDRLGAIVGEADVVVPVWRGGRQPTDAYEWMPAALADLVDATSRLEPGAEPWPGRLPAPSPAMTPAEPIAAEVLDATGVAVRVTGRGGISAAPAQLAVGTREVVAIVGWAGPWPVEERWWDPARRRRIARFQLLTEAGRAYLAVVERQRWWLVARYG